MRPELGLVCLSSDRQVSYRALTRTRLLSLEPTVRVDTLSRLYADNVERLASAVEFCAARGIRLYRMPTGLLPFSDSAHGEGLVEPLGPRLAEVGRRATELGVRIVSHPDQFCVLSSDSSAVVANSIRILQAEARVFELLGLPRSPWASINVHGGKGGRSNQLVARVLELPDEVRARLTFENDERAYGSAEIANVCVRTGQAMVFDAHHHTCHARLDGYDDPSVGEMAAVARSTWPEPSWQQTHISNGIDGPRDPRHSDYVTAMPESYADVPWIEVEAKAKELAIARLRETWGPLVS